MQLHQLHRATAFAPRTSKNVIEVELFAESRQVLRFATRKIIVPT